jgi:hypothetical protein
MPGGAVNVTQLYAFAWISNADSAQVFPGGRARPRPAASRQSPGGGGGRRTAFAYQPTTITPVLRQMSNRLLSEDAKVVPE